MVNKKILFLALLIVLALPSLALAASLQGIVDGAVNVSLIIASGVVVILWVVTGILFLTAQGAPQKLSSAKKALFAAIAGTILVLVAQGAMDMIRKALNINP